MSRLFASLLQNNPRTPISSEYGINPWLPHAILLLILLITLAFWAGTPIPCEAAALVVNTSATPDTKGFGNMTNPPIELHPTKAMQAHALAPETPLDKAATTMCSRANAASEQKGVATDKDNMSPTALVAQEMTQDTRQDTTHNGARETVEHIAEINNLDVLQMGRFIKTDASESKIHHPYGTTIKKSTKPALVVANVSQKPSADAAGAVSAANAQTQALPTQPAMQPASALPAPVQTATTATPAYSAPATPSPKLVADTGITANPAPKNAPAITMTQSQPQATGAGQPNFDPIATATVAPALAQQNVLPKTLPKSQMHIQGVSAKQAPPGQAPGAPARIPLPSDFE